MAVGFMDPVMFTITLAAIVATIRTFLAMRTFSAMRTALSRVVMAAAAYSIIAARSPD
jgi:hypothetical protein